jgi:hypothetical protein
VLVRDVAYGQVPRASRGGKHSRAGAWIERLGRADDHAELVAHHYAAALELARATGGADPQIKVAAEAAVMLANGAWRAGRRADGEAALTRALARLEGRPPSQALAEALAESARLAAFNGRPDEAAQTSARALGFAEELGLDELRARILNTLGLVSYIDGDLRTAKKLVLDVIDGGVEPVVGARPGADQPQRRGGCRRLRRRVDTLARVGYRDVDPDGRHASVAVARVELAAR